MFFFYDTPENLGGIAPSLAGNIDDVGADMKNVKDGLQKESDILSLRNNDIAELTGWSTSKTSKVTSGKQNLTSDDAKTWSRALGYTPDPFINNSIDLRSYKLSNHVRSMPDVFEAYFDSLNDNLEKIIVKYEMPLSMLMTLGVNISDYAVRANSSFYEVNIRSNRKHGENATYVKFWHRSTRIEGETTPKFGIWISPGNEKFLFAVYIERDEIDDQLVEDRKRYKDALQIDESDTDDFANFARNNQDWIPRYVRTGEIFSFGTDTNGFPDRGQLEDSFIELFKMYCNLVWEVKGVDLLPDRLKYREELSVSQKFDILNGYSDFYYEIKDEARSREKDKCENNPEHSSFLDSAGRPYMDVIPLIPFSCGTQFGQAIVSTANAVCLCPMCKAQFFYGITEAREDMVIKLYRKHSADLYKVGIDLSLVQVLASNNLS